MTSRDDAEVTLRDDVTLLGKVTSNAKEVTSRIGRHVVMHVT